MKADADQVEGFTHLNYHYRTGSGARDLDAESMTEILVTIGASFSRPSNLNGVMEISVGGIKAVRVHVADALDAGLSLFDVFSVFSVSWVI